MHLHIERLVLDVADLGRQDLPRVQAALETELRHLFGVNPAMRREHASRDVEPAARIGRQIASSVHASLLTSHPGNLATRDLSLAQERHFDPGRGSER